MAAASKQLRPADFLGDSQSVAVGAGTGTSVRSRPASPRAFPFEASANPDDIACHHTVMRSCSRPESS